ncbi:unnamed protein product [Brassica oleracea]
MIMTIRMIGHHLMDSLISCSLIKLSSHHFFSFLDPWSQIGLLKRLTSKRGPTQRRKRQV